MSAVTGPATVLVTGANGFLAVPIVRQLLERGYTVVGTARSKSKTEYLAKTFASHGNKLQFAYVSDVAADGAFDEILHQWKFDVVLHTSSPFHYDVKDVAKELYEPAVKGTINVLKSIKAHAPSVKRVVITGSFASIINRSKGDWPEHVYSEADWNPMTYEEGLANSDDGYNASKLLAEKAAWEFIDKEKPSFALTMLCPVWIWGPPEQEVTHLDHLNTSSAVLYKILYGLEGGDNGYFWSWTDVRDCALAHILAFESPAAANQRYFIATGITSPKDILNWVRKTHPENAAGFPEGKGYPPGGVHGVDHSKSERDLGLKYTPLETMLQDAYDKFEELREKLNKV